MENQKLDLRNNEFFNTLPFFIQESIMQSNVTITTEQELKNIASNIFSSL